MKIYEKPLVDVRTFDVEDVMTLSGELSMDNTGFNDLMNASATGVVFQW